MVRLGFAAVAADEYVALQRAIDVRTGPRHLSRASDPGTSLQGEQTRRGLQRFIRASRREIRDAYGAVARSRVEVHGDGSVSIAFTRDGGFPGAV
ncbi:MAG: hypothetical protein WKF73_07210 [Nocardioidaceae bacterium]